MEVSIISSVGGGGDVCQVEVKVVLLVVGRMMVVGCRAVLGNVRCERGW